ncbi:quinone-dependent dihydroorotate dehydrogenase [Legionella londiniensis]|nr:quinone-dependent dihydroorotate dehydrogenase [Legionella londiniensis]
MYQLIKPILFKLDAEKAHDLILKVLTYLPQFCFAKPAEKPITAWGMKFKHPIGLAAGLDKNGAYIDALSKLGFSFIEIGTVTPRPQPGNPKPRLFRLPDARAIINRMGFNNDGVDVLVSNVQKARYHGILGINIGKNKDTPLDHAADDYLYCLRKVYPFASYVTVNISSPNTPELRKLQQDEYLPSLLGKLQEERIRLTDEYRRHVPLVIKLSPDETDDNLKRVGEMIVSYKIDGIIATNTTWSRKFVEGLAHANEEGGLSGSPLASRSTDCIRILREAVGEEMVIIGAGGIDNVDTANEKLKAGADLLQVYTGLIYQGPSLIHSIVKNLIINH